MVSNPPKVSFIPKGPLAREESFMERRRPRSITGFFAIFIFIVSVGSYAGFSFYKKTLLEDVQKKAENIAAIQRTFVQAPEINKAKVFRARADLAKELLSQHVVVSPIFAFLSNNTLGSILYDSFSFKRDGEVWSLDLTGEAPSYASLAYQSDVLQKKSSENEFVSFSISNIALTKSGTVTFSLSVDFSHSQLSYVKKSVAVSATEEVPSPEVVAPETPVKTAPSFGVNNTSTVVLPPVGLPTVSVTSATTTTTASTSVSFRDTSAASGWTVAPVSATSTVPKAVTSPITSAPAAKSFWSWFKFW